MTFDINRHYTVISAYRTGKTDAENLRATSQLYYDLVNMYDDFAANVPVAIVEGYYNGVYEQGFACNPSKLEGQDYIDKLTALAEKYKQDELLLVFPFDVWPVCNFYAVKPNTIDKNRHFSDFPWYEIEPGDPAIDGQDYMIIEDRKFRALTGHPFNRGTLVGLLDELK